MINGASGECAYRKQDRDAAKAMMACIDSRANRVCLQAQKDNRPKGEESQSELEWEMEQDCEIEAY